MAEPDLQPNTVDTVSGQQTLRLLIVDDAQLDRKLFASTLARKTKLEAEVFEASSIEEALALCESRHPNCVLLDQNLQGSNGIEWIDELKSRAGRPHLPIIMLTGAGDEALAVAAIHAGAADYLSKSKATGAALERAITNALRHAQLESSIDEERTRTEKMHEQLARKNEELQSLYHTVSHELKTPLTAAREFVSLMLDEVGGPLTATQREFLETAQGCCDRLAFLLNNWLDTVRSETGKLELNLAPVDVAEVVRAAVTTYEVIASKHGIDLCGQIDNVGEATVDSERLQQVMANLLSNAFKFTAPGGTVVVACTGDEAAIDISVADTGRGIHPAHQDQVFSPFFQAEKTDTSTAHGMGLGLHVCRTIAERHGGRLTLVSEPGVGSTFTICLPRLAHPEKGNSRRNP